MAKTIEKYNDAIAGKYDAATSGKFEWRAPAELEAHIKPFIRPGMEVLDVGCGTGQTAKIFIDKGARVTGIDISEEMLKIAGTKFNFKKLVKCDIEQGLTEIAGGGKFDIIIAVGVFEFIKDIKKSLQELKQFLKEEGVIAFTYEVFDPENKYGTDKIATLGAGMENPPELLDFLIYRRNAGEIDEILRELGLRLIKRNKFQAYLQSNKLIPVDYELILVK